MLRLSIHHCALHERNESNRWAALDIAYDKHEAMADYAAVLFLAGVGYTAPVKLTGYPRWSASIWDLVARTLGATVYGPMPIPPSEKPDRRCAYATRACAVIEAASGTTFGRLLGSASITQIPKQRGHYNVVLEEDILGRREGQFEFGTKRLNPAELFMRAACWALRGEDVPGPRPKLLLPATVKIGGVDLFDVEGLAEPARTGFRRFQMQRDPLADLQALAKAQDYVTFLMEG